MERKETGSLSKEDRHFLYGYVFYFSDEHLLMGFSRGQKDEVGTVFWGYFEDK